MILCAELQILFLSHAGAKQEFLKDGVVWSAVYRRQDVTLDYWKLPISPTSFPDPLQELLLSSPEDDQNKINEELQRAEFSKEEHRDFSFEIRGRGSDRPHAKGPDSRMRVG